MRNGMTPIDRDHRLDLAHVFMTAACALIIAYIIGSLTMQGMTAHVAEQIAQEITQSR
jgi:hypothetical protein